MSIELAGTTEAVDIPGPVTVTKNRAVMTIMMWVRFDTLPAAAVTYFVYSTGAAGSTLTRINLQHVGATPGQPRCQGRALDADPAGFVESATVLGTGVWIHLAAVLNYAGSSGKIYINGVLDTSAAISGGPFGAGATQNTDTDDARIGGRANSATQGVDGRIEDVALYDYEVPAAGIATIYAMKGKMVPFFGLQHRYPLVSSPPGTALVTTPCVANPERINGLPIGAPVFREGPLARRLQIG